ncbi:YobI family P-loop NTPase [Glycomyces sp. MUSA5-2]|uniref:YobI family P-loop NTPase n=1 Tax=Glycomyces sp. MUSA5-2 TaxID=2053002 RepID=UPI00300B328E
MSRHSNGSNTEQGATLSLLTLTPAFSEADHGLYTDAITVKLQEKAVRNIALTGSYGTGKSSVLDQVAADYKGKKAIQISFASLGIAKAHPAPGVEPSPADTITNLIQKEIVKQLLYREDPVRLPGSRYRRISGLRPWREVGIALALGLPLFLLFALAGWTDKLFAFAQPDLGRWDHLFVALSSVSFILGLRLLFHNQIHIDQIGAGSTIISLSTPTSTYFDEYLDEIVYFFEVTKLDLVIFEDLDRFEDPHIFETLRALNTTLNGAKQLGGRTIRFIYAIKDSIFDQLGFAPNIGADQSEPSVAADRGDAAAGEVARANRTKFFDLVIPMVPFITHRNTRDHMFRIMKDLDHKVSLELFDRTARHVAEMRLLKNLRNEFAVFRAKLIGTDGSGLDLQDDQLFAMVLYKNTHLSDFEAIRFGTSLLDQLYRIGRDLVRKHIARLDSEATAVRQQLQRLDAATERATNLGDRLIADLSRTARRLLGTISNYQFEGAVVNEDKLRSPQFWDRFLTGTNPLIAITNRGTQLQVAPEDASEVLDGPVALTDWDNDAREALTVRLIDIKQSRDHLLHADMRELAAMTDLTITYNSDQMTFLDIAKVLLQSELAVELMQHGYLNRDFTLYTATYQTERVGPKAANFIMHHVDPNVMDEQFDLDPDDVEAVLRERGSSIANLAMLNIAVWDYLLANEHPLIGKFVTWLLDSGEARHRFLTAYLAGGKHQTELIRELTATWTNIFSFLVTDLNADEPTRQAYFDTALGSLASEIHYRTDTAVREYLEQHYPEFTTLTTHDLTAESSEALAEFISNVDASFPSLAPLSEPARKIVVTLQRFPVTRQNLITALWKPQHLTLDEIHVSNRYVYVHVLDHLEAYLNNVLDQDEYRLALSSTPSYITVLEDLAERKSPHLATVIERSAPGCQNHFVTAFPESAWPFLAAAHRFPATFANITAYVESIGGIDAGLGSLLTAEKQISTDGEPEEERAALAYLILAARSAIPDPLVRVRLVVSLSLQHRLVPDQIEPEPGRLIGLLIKRRIIEDDAATFALTRDTDWATREFAITTSSAFAHYCSPNEIPETDLPMLLESKQVAGSIKADIITELRSFTPTNRRDALEAAARYARKHNILLPLKEIHRIAVASGSAPLVLPLLEPQLDQCSLSDLKPILAALEGEYDQMTSANGRRLKLPLTHAVIELAHRLQALGPVSTVDPNGSVLKVNMRRS